MTERSYRGLLVVLAVLGLTLDQAGKYGVFRWLYEHPTLFQSNDLRGEYDVVPGVFKLLTQYTRHSEESSGVLAGLRLANSGRLPRVNHGALFGLGSEHTALANGLFAVISVLAAGAIVYWGTRPSARNDGILCVALGLILGGTLGNLYDRLVFGGVRDFLYFYWIEWPVFNIADCCLVCGAGLLLVQAFWTKPVSQPDSSVRAVAVPTP